MSASLVHIAHALYCLVASGMAWPSFSNSYHYSIGYQCKHFLRLIAGSRNSGLPMRYNQNKQAFYRRFPTLKIK